MAFIPKKRKAVNGKVDANKAYSLKDASALVKEVKPPNLTLLLTCTSAWALTPRKPTRLSAVP